MKRQLSILTLLLGCLLTIWANASATVSTASAVFANQKHVLTPTSISTLTGVPLNTPTPMPTPTRNLDPRLDALGVTIEDANVAPGQPYWRVIEVLWHDEEEAGGRHHIYVDVLSENGDSLAGKPVKFFWSSGEEILLTEPRPTPEYGANFPMYAAGNAYHVQVEGLPSDVVHGLGLGSIECRDWNIHVEYLLKFQLALGQAGTSTPTLTPTSTPTPHTPTPIPDGLMLNEFMPRPVSDWNGDGEANTGDEYIELINLGNQPFDLTGLQLDDSACGSSPYTLSGILEQGEIIVFFGGQTKIALNDYRDEVRLLAGDGTVLDEYSYSSPAQDQAWSRDDAGVWHDDWPPSPSEPTTLTPTPTATRTPFPINSTLYLPLMFSSPSPPTTMPFAGQIVETYTNCGVTQVFGVVHDAAGQPLPGTEVRLMWEGGPELYTTAGTYIRYETDASGWDFTLQTHPVANTWYVAIVDEAGNLLSEELAVQTDGSCNQGDVNVVKVRFMANASASGFGVGIQPHMIYLDRAPIYAWTKDLGLGWLKQQIEWKVWEASQGHVDWSEMDAIVEGAHANGLTMLFSIVSAPDWAREAGYDASVAGPPADPNTFATFNAAVAERYCGQGLGAIEVWNEQNLHYEWGNKPLNPADYIALLRPSYAAIKAACPSMIVVSGALSPAGNVGSLAIDDFTYMEGMLQNGLLNHADAIGAHPSGYNVPPSLDHTQACAYLQKKGASFMGPCNSSHHSWSFRSTIDGYADMIQRHRGGKLIWATEFGWAAGGAFHPSYGYANDNSFEEQAEWTVEAYQYMRDSGQVGAAFLWNLNFRIIADGTEKAQWGILANDGSPLPAYTALQAMPK